MSKAAKASPALPRKEYPVELVVIQGRKLEPIELTIGEMPATQLVEASKDFFVVLGAMMARDDGAAIAGDTPLTRSDTNGLLFDVTFDALKRVTAGSADIPLAVLELADNDCLEEAVFAAVKANRPFFAIWCKRFGIDLDALMAKGLEWLAPK